jgi:hypothetical protein
MAVPDISLAEPCFVIERDNMLAVDADEAMDDLQLKFFRRGEPRGEVELASLRPGHPMIVKLPATLCTGVAQSKVEIRASRGSGSSEATFGPYYLRC